MTMCDTSFNFKDMKTAVILLVVLLTLDLSSSSS